MKYTLLGLTQKVLSSIDGDEINAIGDTVESNQVVDLIQRVYGDIAEGMDYPERYTLFGLTSSGDSTKPTVMLLPTDSVKNLAWVKYDNKKVGETDTDFQPVEYKSPEAFLREMHALRPSQDNTLVTYNITVNGQTVQIIVRSDKAPQFYTSWDDVTLVFDSYDAAVDTTLQTSKTLCYGESVLPWSRTNSFVIPIDDHQLLLNTVIAWAWSELKQTQNAKAEREVIRQSITTERKKHAVDPMENFRTMTPNYGRK